MYTVEVPLLRGNLASSMIDMRVWLDNRHVEPDNFRQSSQRHLLELDFKIEDEAAAFAEAFGGRVIAQQSVPRRAAP